MRYYIYKITFMSGSTYIGEHLERKKNDDYITSYSYYKKNKDIDPILKKEILIEVKDEQTMHIMETLCIIHDKCENALNKNGTLGSWVYKYSSYRGKFVTEETRLKLSKLSKGKQVSKETREKISKAQKGVPESESTKRKISERMKGKAYKKGTHVSEEGKRNMRIAMKKRIESGWVPHNKGKKGEFHHSEETKQKLSILGKNMPHKKGYKVKFKNPDLRSKRISDALKGKKSHSQSELSRERISKKLTGIVRSSETKKKMSNAKKGQKYVTNGYITKCLNADEAERFLIENTEWRYGQTRARRTK